MADGVGAGAHNAHPPLQHINKLGQLIQGGTPQPAAQRCYPPITRFDLNHFQALIGAAHVEGAKLVDRNFLTVKAIATLAVDHRPRRTETHPDHDREHHWPDQGYNSRCQDHITEALDHTLHPIKGRLPNR